AEKDTVDGGRVAGAEGAAVDLGNVEGDRLERWHPEQAAAGGLNESIVTDEGLQVPRTAAGLHGDRGPLGQVGDAGPAGGGGSGGAHGHRVARLDRYREAVLRVVDNGPGQIDGVAFLAQDLHDGLGGVTPDAGGKLDSRADAQRATGRAGQLRDGEPGRHAGCRRA